MNGIIGFKNYKIRCILGDNPEEREQEQIILVDLKVEADFSKCAISDDLSDTVDYVRLAQICTDLAVSRRYQMMETFAAEALNFFLKDFPIRWGWIRIKKPLGLPSAEHSFVELELTRAPKKGDQDPF